MKKEALVALDSVEAGWELSRTITDDNGNTLVHAGIEVNEKLLKRLQRRGVDKIWLYAKTRLSEEERESMSAAIEADLAQRFSGAQEYPQMQSLYEAVRDYRLGELE